MDDRLPAGWECKTDATGRVYYVDHINRKTQWECPFADDQSVISRPGSISSIQRSRSRSMEEILREVKNLEEEGRKIIIIGDHGHDEVVGIASQVKDPIIIATAEEAKALRKTKRAGVVSQSTQTIENVQEIINVIMTKVFDLRFVNTICFPTKRNQSQIKELAKQCDVMIVIGSFTSANSKRLTALAKERNENSYQVATADEIEPRWLKQAETVGVSAGASTPDNIINDVLTKIKEIGKVPEEMIYG